MRATELIRVIAVHMVDMSRRVLWELPLRSRSWTPCGMGQLLSLVIVGVSLLGAMSVVVYDQWLKILIVVRVCGGYIDVHLGLLSSYILLQVRYNQDILGAMELRAHCSTLSAMALLAPHSQAVLRRDWSEGRVACSPTPNGND